MTFLDNHVSSQFIASHMSHLGFCLLYYSLISLTLYSTILAIDVSIPHLTNVPVIIYHAMCFLCVLRKRLLIATVVLFENVACSSATTSKIYEIQWD